MLTRQEKRDFVLSIINQPVGTTDQHAVQKLIYEQLLRDTNCGKLYKYRSFDSKGNSLKNLESGTLHCSKATGFNDPFDCKIGVTFESLFKAKYGAEIEFICRVLDRFLLVVRGEINFEDCDEDEQRIIMQLMKKDRLMQFINQDYSWISTDEDRAAVLKANAVLALELMQTVLSDQKLSPAFGVCSSMLPQLLAIISENGILELHKDNPGIEELAAAQGITADVDEIDLTTLLCKKINPELAAATDDVQRLMGEWDMKIATATAELFQIGCLCTDPKNRLMWSHYAAGHKGFCVEYDFSSLSDDELSVLPLPVFYSSDRPLIPWEPAFDKTSESMEMACRQLMLGLLVKDDAWSYENEWRIFIGKDAPSELKMPRVSCVYLGASINEEDQDKIIEIAHKHKIPVKKMKIDRGKYELHAEDFLTFQ